MTSSDKHAILKNLPGVDHLLELVKQTPDFIDIPRSIIVDSLRDTIEKTRNNIINNYETDVADESMLKKALFLAKKKIQPKLVNVINATGVVLHTNLGRALLCDDALKNITKISQSFSNLEMNIKTGKRGIRYEAIEELLCELTGAQSAIAVNNNAAAVLLALNTIAKDTQVVVSRGELVEIGGSFRIPDVMSKSGCILKEVGTTNRTHLKDYETAVCDQTGLFLKVHASNYKIEGFTASVELKDLTKLGVKNNIPVMEDLGSGTLIDFSKYGLPFEPTIADSVSAGADIVTFSGDKLLGGPQAGIIVGKKESLDKIKKNPLTRALRIDKMTLAALESTLKLYRDEQKAILKIPTLRMLTMPYKDICKKADRLFKSLKKEITALADIAIVDMNSRPGGGSFPQLNLATRCITLKPANMSVSKFEIRMRMSTPSIIGRIEDNRYIIDPRTLQKGEDAIILSTILEIVKNNDK